MACVSLKQLYHVQKTLNFRAKNAEKRIRSSMFESAEGPEKITIVVIQFNESVFVVIL